MVKILRILVATCMTLAVGSMPLAYSAASDPAMPPQAMIAPAQFDWIEHTQVTLSELKSKLNLTPSQGGAWDAWSGGVMGDAHKQLGPRTNDCKQGMPHSNAWISETTPDQMAHGIACLRAQTAWMQAHLIQLEAAQVRTKSFYETLDSNQKTIFDLFWHEIYHRASGHHGEFLERDN